ncbi:MAG: hypothetical protein LBM65_06225 [Oscillospiraceae bacterium]|jgi:hypothetical protein|nr:hypothetical protein [Oscillospiraceae bacterium]
MAALEILLELIGELFVGWIEFSSGRSKVKPIIRLILVLAIFGALFALMLYGGISAMLANQIAIGIVCFVIAALLVGMTIYLIWCIFIK